MRAGVRLVRLFITHRGNVLECPRSDVDEASLRERIARDSPLNLLEESAYGNRREWLRPGVCPSVLMDTGPRHNPRSDLPHEHGFGVLTLDAKGPHNRVLLRSEFGNRLTPFDAHFHAVQNSRDAVWLVVLDNVEIDLVPAKGH